jgi:hypothetical protein
MKTIYVCMFCASVLVLACKKEMQQTKLNSTNASSSTQADGPVRKPVFVFTSTTKTQFIATADGSGTSNFTLNFSSRQVGITIESLTFLAYSTDSTDALAVFAGDNGFPGFFQPTHLYASAKAITHINGTDIKLPNDGSSVAVTFHVLYRSPVTSGIKSGDTVSIQLNGLEYINLTSPYILFENVASNLSPEIMITGAKPVIEIDSNVDVLHNGLTNIFTVNYSSVAGPIGINNLPLSINADGAKFSKDLIVKDENHQTINTTTVQDKNKYTILFSAGFKPASGTAHTFYVYAPVYEIDGSASIQTHLQNARNLSWTDVAGGRTVPYTTENETYFRDYPATVITTHN